MKRIVVKPRAKKTDIVNDACRTFTFFKMDSYIFNDVEEKEKEPSHSDESGYLSESELVVDDSDWIVIRLSDNKSVPWKHT